ncbi:hypothetical protein ACIQU4_15500 [Streptomyces sp. NPDC090741]|uniref:hypothetical protein n=1 Tax=Streptomyces sp. NPDC090741 TaxID=3365967 RepID=UPI003815AF6F
MPETTPASVHSIAEAIRDRRSYIASKRDAYFLSDEKAVQPVGGFIALAGAEIGVDIHATFTRRYLPTGGEEQVVRFSVIAECAGFGCVDPQHTVTSPAKHPLATDADETGKAPFLMVPDALKWAQAHAETCRAMPRPGA